jgi:ABC-type glycerol-3-phosphate transport system substrate-binding protein
VPGAVVLAGVLALVLAACSPAPAATATTTTTTTTVTVRLWDDQVAQAHAESFAEFSRQNPDVTVALDLVPYADYFATLPDTLAAGTADDVFWLNSSYFGEAGGTATIEAPTGPRFGAGAKAFQPVLSEVFAGRTPVGTGLQAAQDAADAAIR